MANLPITLTTNTKSPRVVSQLKYAQGLGGILANSLPVCLIGHILPSGVAASDYEVFDVPDADEGAAYVGRTSELGRMILSSFKPGCVMRALAVPEPSGGAAATLDVVITGTATAFGSFDVHVGGAVVTVDIADGDTATDVGGECESKISAVPDLFCTPSNTTGTVTLTCVNKGIRGNQHVVFLDTERLAAGISVSLSGGTAFANGGVPFSGGGGTDTIATILAAIVDEDIPYAGWANNSSTDATAIRTQAVAKAGPAGAGPQNDVLVTNVEGVTNANDLPQASFNQFFGMVAWAEGHRQHPSVLAAMIAVHRSVVESAPVTVLGDPNHRYLNEPLAGALPHYKPEHTPKTSITDTALSTGVTPLVTKNGQLCILRAVTSYSLDGTNPDDRVLDTSDAVVPQRVLRDMKAIWEQEFALVNDTVGPDLPNGEAAPTGRATPSGWAARMNSRIKLEYIPSNLVLQFDPDTGEEMLATAVYNTSLKCLVSDVPVMIVPKNYVLGNIVRQIPA